MSFEGENIWVFTCSIHIELLRLGVSSCLLLNTGKVLGKYKSIYYFLEIFMGFVANSLVFLLIRLQQLSSILLTLKHLSICRKLYFMLFFIGLNEKRQKLLSSFSKKYYFIVVYIPLNCHNRYMQVAQQTLRHDNVTCCFGRET